MLNLLPWRKEENLRKNKILGVILIVIIMCNLLLLFSFRFLFTKKTACIENENKIIINKIKEQDNYQKILSNELKSFNFYLIQNRRIKKQESIVQVLNAICELLPTNCRLTCLLLNNTGLVLDGIMADTKQNILKDFANKLQKNCALKVNIREAIQQNNEILFTLALVFIEK